MPGAERALAEGDLLELRHQEHGAGERGVEEEDRSVAGREGS